MSKDLADLSAECLWDIIAPDDEEKRLEIEQEKHVAVTASHETHKLRRIACEFALEQELPWHFEKGTAYHCLSWGDVDSMTYLRVVLKQQPLEYLMIATWCIAMADAQELERFLDQGLIKRIDFYLGMIFKKRSPEIFNYLETNCIRNGGSISVLRSHCKTMACFDERFDCAIESSANLNENARIENTVITVNSDVALFYKDFFDEIKTSGKSADWQPYDIKRQIVN